MTKSELEAKFDQFVLSNNNKYISLLSPGRQCFDLTVAFTDLLGIPHYQGNPSPFPYVNAYQIYTDYKPWHAQYFDRIPNTPDYVPQKGDILAWDGKLNNGIGHTAVATGEGNFGWFKSFDQNWIIGAPAQIVKHDYKYLLGALRLKVTQASTQPSMDTNWQQILDYAKGKFLVNEAKDVIKYIEDLDAYRKSESKAKDEKDATIKSLEDENLHLSEKIEIERSNHIAELAQKDTECQTKINEIKSIPPKIEEKIVTMPYEWHHWVLRAIIPVLQDWDKKLPVSGYVRK